MANAFLWWTGAVVWAWVVMMSVLMMALDALEQYKMRQARNG
jgi:hypothetical protein